MAVNKNLVFLKLGGSLITDKIKTSTALPDVISQIAGEIKSARENPDLQILLGHGSGSFGHMAAKDHGTKQGVKTKKEWRGFAEVWHQASTLNRIVIDILHQEGIEAIAFPASSSTITENGKIINWDLGPIQNAINRDILPVVFGDVVFDQKMGGTILSTEAIFRYFAKKLYPRRIFLAGIEDGVYSDYPTCKELIEEINPQNYDEILPSLGGSAATDVTGGMASKVAEMYELVVETDSLEVQIFSGKEPGTIEQALTGQSLGTKIVAGEK